MQILKISALAFALAVAPSAAFAGGSTGGAPAPKPHFGGMGHGPKMNMPRGGMGGPRMGGGFGGGHVKGGKMGGHMGGPRPQMGGSYNYGPRSHMGGGYNKGPRPHVGGGYNNGGNRYARRNWGGHTGGRWNGGHRAPGGWNNYQRPFYGFSLPSYWTNSSFYIPNYASYGFAQPAIGYGWSRYYNDAVMTDRYGRVYNYIPDYNWGDYEDAGYGAGYYDSGYGGAGYGEAGYYGGGYNGGSYYDDGYGRARKAPKYRGSRYGGRGGEASAIGGGLAGAAIGAIGGSIIAGRGDRTAGALIGGGLGALAGVALGSAGRDGDRYGRGGPRGGDYDYGNGYPADRVTYGTRAGAGGYGAGYGDGYGQVSGGYGSRGHWDGDSQNWESDNAGAYPAPIPNGDPRGNGGYNAGHNGNNSGGYNQAGGASGGYNGGGYNTGGGYSHTGGHNGNVVYGNDGYTTITVNSQPVVTTTKTVEYVTEYVSAPARKRYYKPRARPARHVARKPRCVCKVVY